MSDVTVMVVDDHPIVRDGLRSLIEDTDDLVFVGEAPDGATAVALAEQHRPTVILMDLVMPGVGGVEATRRILEAGHAQAVLVLTMNDDDAAVFAAIRAGAKGYLLKGAPGTEVVESIRIVASGRAILSTALADRMERYFARSSGSSERFPTLSSRELEVLTLLSRGMANDEIATNLVLSRKTVQNYVSSIMAKMSVSSRAAAIARARDEGIC